MSLSASGVRRRSARKLDTPHRPLERVRLFRCLYDADWHDTHAPHRFGKLQQRHIHVSGAARRKVCPCVAFGESRERDARKRNVRVRSRRVLRAVRKAVKLRRLINTLALALPAVANVGSLLLLMQFMFAVVGVQLFAQVKHGAYMDHLSNFESFWPALMTLVRARFFLFFFLFFFSLV